MKSSAKGEDELHPDFAEFVTDDEIAAFMPSMVVKHFGASKKAISQALASIGRINESKTMRLQTKSVKTRHYVVPDENIWRGIVQWYYYTDEESEDKNPDCPKVLRSRRYGAGM